MFLCNGVQKERGMAFILLPCHFGFLSAALKVARKYVIGFIRALKMKQKSSSCILKQRHSRLNRLKEWGTGIIPLYYRYQCFVTLLKLTTKMTLGPWAIALCPDGSLHSIHTPLVRESQPRWPAGNFVKMNHIMLQLERNSGNLTPGPMVLPSSMMAQLGLLCFVEPVRQRKENIHQMWHITFNNLNIYKVFIWI